MIQVRIKRVYDDPHGDDGYRVFVDRLWPRGESHTNFKYDSWPNNLAPSAQLREWFHLDPDSRWAEFRKKYLDELCHTPAAISFARKIASKPKVTLLYASRDTEHNNAAVFRDFLMTQEANTASAAVYSLN